ncbi:hypothetical protein [Bradyrhizobium sp. JR3.5]
MAWSKLACAAGFCDDIVSADMIRQFGRDLEILRMRALRISQSSAGSMRETSSVIKMLPAVMTGKCLPASPEIIVSDLVPADALHVVLRSRTPTVCSIGPTVDRNGHSEIARIDFADG